MRTFWLVYMITRLFVIPEQDRCRMTEAQISATYRKRFFTFMITLSIVFGFLFLVFNS